MGTVLRKYQLIFLILLSSIVRSFGEPTFFDIAPNDNQIPFPQEQGGGAIDLGLGPKTLHIEKEFSKGFTTTTTPPPCPPCPYCPPPTPCPPPPPCPPQYPCPPPPPYHPPPHYGGHYRRDAGESGGSHSGGSHSVRDAGEGHSGGSHQRRDAGEGHSGGSHQRRDAGEGSHSGNSHQRRESGSHGGGSHHSRAAGELGAIHISHTGDASTNSITKNETADPIPSAESIKNWVFRRSVLENGTKVNETDSGVTQEQVSDESVRATPENVTLTTNGSDTNTVSKSHGNATHHDKESILRKFSPKFSKLFK